MRKTPTPELIALTWLRSQEIVSLVADVATDVPDPAGWRTQLFVRIQHLGGGVDDAVPLADPVFRVSFYAKPKESTTQPPWNVVNVLAQDVWKLTYTEAAYGTLILPPQFNNVQLAGVEAQALPSRVTGDPRNLARYDLDLAIPYIEEMD